MNISTILRMIKDGDLSAAGTRYLIDCRCECEWLDYKEVIHLDNDKGLCDFAKDVLAMKNSGGGYLVIGVEDKTWKPKGIAADLPYDSKLIRDKVRKATGVDLDIDIVHHKIFRHNSARLFALICIRSSKKFSKLKAPTLVKINFKQNESFGLRSGDIYARKGDSTVRIDTEQDLRGLIDEFEERAAQDEFERTKKESPFAIEDGTYRLLEKGFDQFVGREEIRKELLDAVDGDPRIWIINVYGPGGVGKSALVNYVVYELYEKRSFESIIQLTAKENVLTERGIEKFGRSLYSLENLLDVIASTFQETPPSLLDQKKELAIEILSAWKTLLVLDNMETVQDGRILEFVQSLPVTSKARVLMTSRVRSGGWELPFSVREFNESELKDFITIKSREMQITFPVDNTTLNLVWQATGGLPLAMQWILGQFRLANDINSIISSCNKPDSPVLEFSFRNIWQRLSEDARLILSIITIFDNPPTSQNIAIATEFPVDRIERALNELNDVTLVTKTTNTTDGRIVYVALPITISFARHQLARFGDFEVDCRQRFTQYCQQISLQESELVRFKTRFERFGLKTSNEKRAAILCLRGESELFIGNFENADLMFKEARDLVPNSSYVLAMSASCELHQKKIGNAANYINEACKMINKFTGSLCYSIKAQIYAAQKNLVGQVDSLKKALEFSCDDNVLRHQYGVALSKSKKELDAIREFTIIIDKEREKIPPTAQLLMTLKTRMINYRRINDQAGLMADIDFIKSIFTNYPNLANEQDQFQEFF